MQITGIEPGSSAAWAGLRAGDIIVSVNRAPVRSLEGVETAMGRGGDALLLNIRRGDGALFIVLR